MMGRPSGVLSVTGSVWDGGDCRWVDRPGSKKILGSGSAPLPASAAYATVEEKRNEWKMAAATASAQAQKETEKWVNVDRGEFFYRELLMKKKVRHFRGEYSQMAHNHHMMPSLRLAFLELNALVNSSECDDEELTVADFLHPPTYTEIKKAKLPCVAAAEAKEPLPEIGLAEHVVRFENYDLNSEDLPPQIEFASNAVLAKYKATGHSTVTHVSLKELNDKHLILQAQNLFGTAVGKISFRKPFQPYTCELTNSNGGASVYAFRVKTEGRFKKINDADVWILPSLKEKKKDSDMTKAPRDEVFTVLFHLFPSADRYERTHTTHFDSVSVKKLQNAFEKAIEADTFEQTWKDIGSYVLLGKAAVEVLKTDDFLTALHFLFFHVKHLWPYNLRGSPMDSCSQMSLLKKFVRSEVKRWTDRGMTYYLRPKPVKDEEEEDDDDDDLDEMSDA
ncbi:hypothetical protein N9S30_00435 [bacterium]|nr:hypothetical protein [bacterium]